MIYCNSFLDAQIYTSQVCYVDAQFTILLPGGFAKMKALAISMSPWLRIPKRREEAMRRGSMLLDWKLLAARKE